MEMSDPVGIGRSWSGSKAGGINFKCALERVSSAEECLCDKKSMLNRDCVIKHETHAKAVPWRKWIFIATVSLYMVIQNVLHSSGPFCAWIQLAVLCIPNRQLLWVLVFLCWSSFLSLCSCQALFLWADSHFWWAELTLFEQNTIIP